MLKRTLFLLCIILLVSCSKQVVKEELPSLQKLDASSLNSYDRASEWAQKSISLLDDISTKGLQNSRTIESYNVAVRPHTKGDMTGVNDTLFYVFNFTDSSGFSIISARQDFPPIIAVTESGRYTVGEPTGNDAFDEYMDGVIDGMTRLGPPHEQYYWYDYVFEGDSIRPKVNVNWGQEDIFGKYCSNGICGCVATAIAQIMTYYKQPSSFIASCDMGNDFSSGSNILLDWDQIVLHTSAHSNPGNCDNVHNNIGALLRQIGEESSMTYHSEGYSSTSEYGACDAITSLGYTIDAGPTTPIVPQIKYFIRRHGPVFMSGKRDQGSGHAWVVDGYKDFKYSYCRYERAEGDGSEPIITQQTILREAHSLHINWGFDGDCNGYFAFNVYDMQDADEYDQSSWNDYNYNTNLQVIFFY